MARETSLRHIEALLTACCLTTTWRARSGAAWGPPDDAGGGRGLRARRRRARRAFAGRGEPRQRLPLARAADDDGDASAAHSEVPAGLVHAQLPEVPTAFRRPAPHRCRHLLAPAHLHPQRRAGGACGGIDSLKKSTVSEMCRLLDPMAEAHRTRDLPRCPYVFLDARSADARTNRRRRHPVSRVSGARGDGR